MEYGQGIGIDLGTTFSLVGCFRNGGVKVFHDENGEKLIPSVVHFTEETTKVGQEAVPYLTESPQNTIYDSKRLIGLLKKDKGVEKDVKRLPFKVSQKEGKKNIYIEISSKDEVKFVLPEEVGGYIVRKLLNICQENLSRPVDQAVITVPARFKTPQRSATVRAGKFAGLEEVVLLHEPTAAALAFNYENVDTSKKNILVYDLGGGTFDVSVINLEDGAQEVKGTDGDTHLGGSDFDQNLIQYCLGQMTAAQRKSVEESKEKTARLRKACIRAKHDLSSAMKAKIDLISFFDEGQKHFALTVERKRFEEINEPLFKETIDITMRLISKIGIKAESVDAVILAGGSTRIPKIRSLLSEVFPSTMLEQKSNPDETVTIGAALYAEKLFGASPETNPLRLLDVVSTSLCTDNFIFNDVLIPSKTKIPTFASKDYVAVSENQKAVSVRVLEGEEEFCDDSKQIGAFTLPLEEIEPGEKPKVTVRFEIDKSHLLTISAIQKGHHREYTHVIKYDAAMLSEEEIKKSAERVAAYNEMSGRDARVAEARRRLEKEIIETKEKLKDTDGFDELKEEIFQKCMEYEQVMEMSELNEMSENFFEEKREEFKAYCEDYLTLFDIARD